jgi:hypothetical protein
MVGRRGREPAHAKAAERTGVGRGLSARDPVFDESLDFRVDGDLADAGDAVVCVEVWVSHLLARPTFKGRCEVALARVVAAGRLHDSFALEGAGGGRVEAALEWLGTMQQAG